MATLAEALAAEAEADTWYQARADNASFDLMHPAVEAYDDSEAYAAYDDSAERAQGAYLDWRRAIATVAGALAGEYGEAAADLLHDLTQARKRGGPGVPEAAAVVQAVFSPLHP